MLMERDAAEACLAVSLHVSRAAGVEGALPVHASLSWFGEGAAEDVGPKKKWEESQLLVRTCQGPLQVGRVRVRSQRRTWESLFPSLMGSRIPTWESTYTAGYAARQQHNP